MLYLFFCLIFDGINMQGRIIKKLIIGISPKIESQVYHCISRNLLIIEHIIMYAIISVIGKDIIYKFVIASKLNGILKTVEAYSKSLYVSESLTKILKKVLIKPKIPPPPAQRKETITAGIHVKRKCFLFILPL